MDATRSESDIFNDLSKLCSSPGYSYVIAFFCIRDTLRLSIDNQNLQDKYNSYDPNALIRTEISILVGLLAKYPITFIEPPDNLFNEHVEKTEALLNELHELFLNLEIISRPEGIKEEIFYGGESAYPFQFRQFAIQKWTKEDDWLKKNKGFSINDLDKVLEAIEIISSRKLESHLLHYSKSNLLEPFIFTTEEIHELNNIDIKIIKLILESFSVTNSYNQNFTNFHSENETNYRPIFKLKNSRYLLFLQQSLLESFYISPFHWIKLDKSYFGKYCNNRGAFPEEFSFEALKQIFGDDKVKKNIDIYKSKKKRVGEIDILIEYSARLIILQVKSKGMQIESRNGNELKLTDDFNEAIQFAYNQANTCAQAILSGKFIAKDPSNLIIEIKKPIKEIYVICLLSEPYPALMTQAKRYLTYNHHDIIKNPLVTDIFFLDFLTEMLSNPLYLLNYIKFRAESFNYIGAASEHDVLTLYLKGKDRECDYLSLGNGSSEELDHAMWVRRQKLYGEATPKGILSHLQGTHLENIIFQLSRKNDALFVDFGLILLNIDLNYLVKLETQLKEIVLKSRKDGKRHYITPFEGKRFGITFYFTHSNTFQEIHNLQWICDYYRVEERRESWLGISIHPISMCIYLVLDSFQGKIRSPAYEKFVKNMILKLPKKTKIGRNDKCLCGSGKKSKFCCGKN